MLAHYNLDPFSVDDNGNTPLHAAAISGWEEAVRLLVNKYNCPIDCRNNHNKTPLFFACKHGHLNIVRMLLSKLKTNTTTCRKSKEWHEETDILIGDLNSRGYNGRTILHQACQAGDVELAENLLQLYCNSLSVDDNGETPLHYAVRGGHEGVAKLLITKYNFSVNCRNNGGQTPLHTACSYSNINVVKMLAFDCKADLKVPDKGNETPLHVAVRCGKSDIAKYLMNEFNCSSIINHKGLEGRTLLHDACSTYVYESELIETLLTHYRADPLSNDDNGNVPLHYAAAKGRK